MPGLAKANPIGFFLRGCRRVLSGSPGRYGATRSRDFASYENFFAHGGRVVVYPIYMNKSRNIAAIHPPKPK
ncbi:TPA: hypothetical protein ACIVON_001424 [Salmonella enterica subsp. enterica serovar Poona]|nr:hypothetical protein [Salmonella enterica]EKB5041449.1 hypothetical protein [Salmonella enterica]EME1067599.1 hypothetical protein [Salmonella enterica]HEC9415928.1 hypothetical protein [Salmonella enterica subsp. enterica serovar Poona]